MAYMVDLVLALHITFLDYASNPHTAWSKMFQIHIFTIRLVK